MVCLEQFIALKNDSEMEYVTLWCLPETIHRVEKRSCSGNTLCAWNNSTSLKTILKWDIFVCLKQFMCEKRSCRGNTRCAWNISCMIQTIHKRKYVVCLKQSVFEKRSSNVIMKYLKFAPGTIRVGKTILIGPSGICGVPCHDGAYHL